MNERGTRELNAILIKRECKPNESMDFTNPKEFDDPQVFDDPKGTSIGSMDCHNPKVYSDTCFTINYRPFHILF